MPLRHFRRQYEQLSQLERGRIIGAMEAEWSARRVARQLSCSDCIVRRCWVQWIQEMSFTRRPGSGCPRQTSHREDRHIVRNARVQPTASSAAILAQIAPSLRAPVSSRTIRRRLAEGHLGSRRPLRVVTLTLTHRRLPLKNESIETASSSDESDFEQILHWKMRALRGVAVNYYFWKFQVFLSFNTLYGGHKS
ncbi:UNVERIFIED_CONTAM: hypothetical protein NCL1_15096 [Trichonephila clavipes]